MRYLLDTNVLREVGRRQPHPKVAAWLASVDDSELAVSVLTLREIERGIGLLRDAKPQAAEDLARRVEVVMDAFGERILPIDRQVAVLWGQLLAESGRHADDAGLAATASTKGLVLVTRNLRDFRGRGVDLLNPYKSPVERLEP